MARKSKQGGIWDAADCAVLLIDYQETVLDNIFEFDRRVIELNARTLATAARAFNVPVILSTVGVKMGVNKPTIASLQAALPGVTDIDRTSMNSWEDENFLAAVKATGRTKAVMAGIVTSVCLAYPVTDALADGFEVGFVEDAVGDSYRELHDTAVLRMAHAGAVPHTTIALVAEWFRDWAAPQADAFRKILVPYLGEMAELRRNPQHQQPKGVTAPAHG